MSAESITLGIRPEHAQLNYSEHTLCFELDINVVEPLGPNQLVHGRIIGLESERDFIAVTPEMALQIHDPLTLSVTPDNLHLFDEHGKRLCPVSLAQRAIA
ncbi:glycerol-3-phosphate ABC transporter, ATP-binding protein [Vibrio furnissii NCTC 11218]|nr:glycerol-3-phosphate ABC transporter, ATP-binding protein [Vibrio furnissii NCTC 11218]